MNIPHTSRIDKIPASMRYGVRSDPHIDNGSYTDRRKLRTARYHRRMPEQLLAL